MPKPTAAWGIDIGQCALKALRLELVDGKPTATAFDYIEHPKILSQPDADPDALTREALEKFLSRNKLGNDIVGISVAGQSGLARFVKLPPVEEKKIPDIVRFEAKQQIPFPLEEVVWDYQKISGGEVVENFAMETEVGLFAMKREMISRYMGQFNAVNIECHVVQMAPLALTNFATYEILKKGGPDAPGADAAGEDDTPRGKKRCSVVLDIGTDSSNLIITDGGKIIWQRPIPLGGSNFTRALTKEMKLTFAKAEHLKRNAAKSPDLAQILKALRPVLQDFVGEVQRSLGYFTNTHRDAHVGYMIGLGSAFRLPGLQKYMAEKLSLDVRKPTGFDRMAGDQVKNDPVFTENLLTFPIAYGLALQGANQLADRKDYGRINTNLLPQEIRVDRMIRAKKPWAAAAAAALLMGTGGLAFGYAMKYSAVNDPSLKKAIEEADTQVKAAAGQASTKATADGEIQKIQTDVKAVIAGNDERLNFARVYEVINAALPRPGEDGNLRDGSVAQLWQTNEGHRAMLKMKERVRAGIPLEKINDEDLTNFLATVNLESVYCRYTDNVKGFIDAADAWAFNNLGDEIGRRMLGSEREEVEENGKKRFKPKAPEGGGWVFQVSGYTFHDSGSDFLANAVLRNFQKANEFAANTATMTDPKTGQKVEKVGKFLLGVKDPVQGKISHAFILVSRPVTAPNEWIGKNHIDALVGGGATGSAAETGPMGRGGGDTGSADGGPPAMSGGGATAGGWVPLTGVGGGSTGNMGDMMGGSAMGGTPGGPTVSAGSAAASGAAASSGDTGSADGAGAAMTPRGSGGPRGMGPMGPMGTGGPTTPAAPATTINKKKTRYEFVLCFIWKEPVLGATEAPK
jgi:type IV pilus assembly protein PilM